MGGKRDTVIAWCDGGNTEGVFTESMMGIVDQTDRLQGWLRIQGLYIAESRNKAGRAFLDQTDASWLWMVDSDMRFPRTALDELLETAHALDRPIVGGLYWGPWYRPLPDGGQVMDTAPQLYSYSEDSGKFLRWNIHKLGPVPPSGRIEVAAAGTGCLLIHRRVLEKMRETHPEPYPFFAHRVVDDQAWGEDITFCVRARELGYPTWVDLNVRCAHYKRAIISGDGEWQIG